VGDYRETEGCQGKVVKDSLDTVAAVAEDYWGYEEENENFCETKFCKISRKSSHFRKIEKYIFVSTLART
jgi:hypothetical protein